MGSFSPRKPLPFQAFNARNTNPDLKTREGRHVFIYQEVSRFHKYSQQVDPCLFEEKSIDLIKRLNRNDNLKQLLTHGCLSQARSYIKTSCTTTLINCNTRTKSTKQISLDGFTEEGREPEMCITFKPTAHNDLEGIPDCPHDLTEWVADKQRVRLESRFHPELTELLLSFPLFERQILILSHATTLTTQEIADLLGVNYNKVNNTRARKIDPVVERWRRSLKG